MFNEIHKLSITGKDLTFIRSANVQAYPCGRRRSQLIDTVDIDGDGEVKEAEKYHIPFDPEARLNTEANNRRHSGLNGYTQTYLEQWNESRKFLTLSLDGYLFTISLDDDCITPDDFSKKLLTKLNANAESSNVTSIYANILLEETPLFSGFKDYNTWVLRDQSNKAIGETCLDLLNTVTINNGSSAEMQKFTNYYFSGLSFSLSPLTEIEGTRSEKNVNVSGNRPQRIVSIRILDKVPATVARGIIWRIHEPARLPHVEHGDVEDSVRINILETNALTQNGIPVPSLKVHEVGDGTFQLQFSFGTKIN